MQSKAASYSMQEQAIDKLVMLQALAHATAIITTAIKVGSLGVAFVVFPFLYKE